MRGLIISSFLALFSVCLIETEMGRKPAADDRATMNLAYPAAPRTDVSDDYFGTKVADPYRWLEDMKSPDTQKWVRAEDDLLQAYLGKLPERAALHRRIRELTSDSLYTQVKK